MQKAVLQVQRAAAVGKQGSTLQMAHSQLLFLSRTRTVKKLDGIFQFKSSAPLPHSLQLSMNAVISSAVLPKQKTC